MTHYATNYLAHVHENQCFVSIRSTENRVDTFFFKKSDLEPLIMNQEENVWIGSEKLQIKISHDKSKATLRINKPHARVSYSSSIQDMQMLLAQLEDCFFRLQYSEEKQEEPTSSDTGDVLISSDILQAINAIITRQNQMLLHEIDTRLKSIKVSKTEEQPVEQLPQRTVTFIPSDMGKSLTGHIETNTTDSQLDAKQLAEQLKSFKDTKK